VIARASDGGATSDLAFAPERLALALERRGERAQLGELTLPLGDVHVFAPALPEGLQLRELAVRLPERTALDVVRASETVVTLAARAPLALDWKLQLADGSRYPLGALPLGPVELRVAVTRDDAGALDVQVVAMCPESCGGIDGLFALADGMVWTHAAALAR
jgi:hypothetical protein